MLGELFSSGQMATPEAGDTEYDAGRGREEEKLGICLETQ